MKNMIERYVVQHTNVGMTVGEIAEAIEVASRRDVPGSESARFDLVQHSRRMERAAIAAFRLGDLQGAFKAQNEANQMKVELAKLAKDDFVSRFTESYRDLARRDQPKPEAIIS